MVCYVGLEIGRVFACYIAIVLVLVVVVFGFVCVYVWDLFWGSYIYLAVKLFAFFFLEVYGKGKRCSSVQLKGGFLMA